MAISHPEQLRNNVASVVVLFDWFVKLSERYEVADNVLDAIPDGWAKFGGEWVRIEESAGAVGHGGRFFREAL